MRCAVSKLPDTVSDDPALFISLVSGSLDLARQCTSYPAMPAAFVADLSNLLGAAAAFAQLHNTYDAQVHSTILRQWLVQLADLEESLFLKSAQQIQLLINAARDGNIIEGLDDVETSSQLAHWTEDMTNVRYRFFSP
jgi:hypothetical protein